MGATVAIGPVHLDSIETPDRSCSARFQMSSAGAVTRLWFPVRGSPLLSLLMRDLHASWFWVAVVSTGAVGLWGLVLAITKRSPGRAFLIGRSAAIGAALIQVGLGVILWQQGLRPGNNFHVFYGVVTAISLSIAYVYRAAMAKRPALTYGLLLLFVMGLGLRAYANVN